MKRQIKVCGMREAENIKAVEALGIDMMGFIFYPPSSRFVAEPPTYLPTNVQRVGVFVNETEQTVITHIERYALDYVQLHGSESPEYCGSLHAQGVKLMKAFSVGQIEDLDRTSLYAGLCEYFLFDTPCVQYGGSGESFDWTLLQHYQGSTPFLLSGGIHEASAIALKSLQHEQLAGFDINSRFEQTAGWKDIKRIQSFLTDLQDTNL